MKKKNFLSIVIAILLIILMLGACSTLFKDTDSTTQTDSPSVNIGSELNHEHTFDITRVEGTCTEPGTETKTCRKCGYEEVTEILSSHSMVEVTSTVMPTCEDVGYTSKLSCEKCEYVIPSEVLPALGHSYEAGICVLCGATIKGEVVEGTKGLTYTLSDDGTYYICSGIGTATDTDIVIANEVDGIPVKSIGSSAFYDCDSLTSIVIPDSVTSIGSDAFSWCSSLTSIVIPDSVTSIGCAAFSGCSSLTSIVIPDSVTSIGDSAFSNCDSLTSIVIPDSVTSIVERAFEGCYSLTSIVIPDSVTSIGDFAFSCCSSLISIVIPEGVTSIGERAFSACSSLTSIVIPDSVTSIGCAAFYGCSKLTSVEFKETNGWKATSDSTFTGGISLSSTELAQADKAATWLKNTYVNYILYRE